MNDWNISNYWADSFRGTEAPQIANARQGWSAPTDRRPWFVEPALRLREDFGPASAPVRLIAAPGAVGKSTFAYAMCSTLNLLLIDLAETVTVGGDMFSGGLAKAGNASYDRFKAGRIGAVFDALDEARLKVTEGSFLDFLADLVAIQTGSQVPVVLFGRTGIVEECWDWFDGHGIEAAVFDVEFFDKPRAVRFMGTELVRLAEDPRFSRSIATSYETHRENFDNLFARVVDKLSDYDRARAGEKRSLSFSGYAPVLQAVALLMAEESENPSSIDVEELAGPENQFLSRVVDRLLKRESEKVRKNLDFLNEEARTVVYDETEQRLRLISAVLGTPEPAIPTSVPMEREHAYTTAINRFLLDHPFRDGERKVSSAPFEADILAYALTSADTIARRAAEYYLSAPSRTPNPFLVDFYSVHGQRNRDETGRIAAPPEHIGQLYASIASRVGPGETASLEFMENDDGGHDADVRLAVYNSSVAKAAPIESIDFSSSALGVLRFGERIVNVTVLAPDLDVEVGNGEVCSITAPSTLDVDRLTIKSRDVTITRERTIGADPHDAESVAASEVRLEAKTAEVPQTVPRVHGVRLSVSWPGAEAYPWTKFRVAANPAEEPRLAEAQRALRRLVMSFRSHSRGRLARLEDKIEHSRMTKGDVGIAVREALMGRGVIQYEMPFYYLDPNALGTIVGANFTNLKDKQFSEEVNAFLTDVLHQL